MYFLYSRYKDLTAVVNGSAETTLTLSAWMGLQWERDTRMIRAMEEQNIGTWPKSDADFQMVRDKLADISRELNEDHLAIFCVSRDNYGTPDKRCLMAVNGDWMEFANMDDATRYLYQINDDKPFDETVLVYNP